MEREGRWIEPFLGSGVVAFNMAPERALLTDKNEYIIRLYQGIQQGRITAETVRAFLLSMWQKDEVKKNRHLYQYWEDFCWHEQPYFYFVGGPQTRRHAVVELLAVREHTARLA